MLGFFTHSLGHWYLTPGMHLEISDHNSSSVLHMPYDPHSEVCCAASFGNKTHKDCQRPPQLICLNSDGPDSNATVVSKNFTMQLPRCGHGWPSCALSTFLFSDDADEMEVVFTDDRKGSTFKNGHSHLDYIITNETLTVLNTTSHNRGTWVLTRSYENSSNTATYRVVVCVTFDQLNLTELLGEGWYDDEDGDGDFEFENVCEPPSSTRQAQCAPCAPCPQAKGCNELIIGLLCVTVTVALLLTFLVFFLVKQTTFLYEKLPNVEHFNQL